MKIAIITGASSGMGMEFARQIDKKCLGLDEIWLVARRRQPMEELASELSTLARIFPTDLTDENSCEPLFRELKQRNPQVRMLINCAGYGKVGAFSAGSEKDALGMIDLNCRALTKMTYHILPYMPERSYLIQLASSAAFLPQPGFGIYAASKAFVLSFTRALREELKKRRISVTAVCPGPVDTPFFTIAEETGEAFLFKKIFMVPKEKVVGKALRDTFRGRDLSVYGLPMKIMHICCKILPQKLILGAYESIVKVHS